MSPGPEKQRGFTLLEVLLAIALFAMLSLLTAQMLTTTIDSNEQTKKHQQRFSAIVRTVNLLDKPIAQYKNRQRANIIGVLFQEAENQLFHSKVAEEVAFGLRLQKLPPAEVAQRTAAALKLCRLESVADAHPLDLHTAQRRMVAVACLEAMAPEILLLDEPSRDFDQHWLAIFEAWLAVCRKRGTSVVAISHDEAFTRRHFSRRVLLEKGRVLRMV